MSGPDWGPRTEESSGQFVCRGGPRGRPLVAQKANLSNRAGGNEPRPYDQSTGGPSCGCRQQKMSRTVAAKSSVLSSARAGSGDDHSRVAYDRARVPGLVPAVSLGDDPRLLGPAASGRKEHRRDRQEAAHRNALGHDGREESFRIDIPNAGEGELVLAPADRPGFVVVHVRGGEYKG